MFYHDFTYSHLLLLTFNIPLLFLILSQLYLDFKTRLNISWTLKLTGISCCLGILVFILTPRFDHEEIYVTIQESPTGTPQASHSLMTKQQDDLISLKGIEKLKVMQEPIFDFSYQFSGDLNKVGPYFYFKKQSFDIYDRGVWKTNITAPTLILDEDDGQPDQWVQLLPTREKPPVMEMKVTPILPVTSFFCMGEVMAIQTDQLLIRAKDNYSQLDQNQLTPYSFKSYHELPLGNLYPVTGQVLPNEHCLEVPAHLKPILEQLIQQDQKLFSLVFLKKIESQLKQRYRYSLDSKGNGEEPLLDLILGKQGWCVHFATAMTLLARYHGYPARVVSGLCLEKTMPHPSQTTARLSHSHAWTEVYIEPLGWTIWDATPESGIHQRNTTSTNLLVETEHPVISFFKQFTRKINLKQSGRGFRFYMILFLSLSLCVYTLIIFIHHKKQPPKTQGLFQSKKLLHSSDLNGIWQRFNLILDENLKIRSNETIAQHTERITPHFPELNLDRLAQMHNAALWGQQELSNDQVEWMESVLLKIKQLNLHSSQTPTHKV